jgi:hypothetical protein
MEIQQRTQAFVCLGNILRKYIDTDIELSDAEMHIYELFETKITDTVEQAFYHNGWFTKENVLRALSEIAVLLEEKNIQDWLKQYPEAELNKKSDKTIGVIMAGNIPLVGFHDMLSVLISGNKIIARLSSQDKLLPVLIADILFEINAAFRNRIFFTETPFKEIDAIIATGSNNSARYFEHYFSKHPHIIRKNRNSIAILSGKETENELYELGNDIFAYYGLGCRNVSKIFVPDTYNFDAFFRAIYEHNAVVNNKKYGNNYDYNKTVYLLNNEKLLDNGFLLLRQDKLLTSPVGVLFYEYYNDLEKLEASLLNIENQLQCVVAKNSSLPRNVDFGQSQKPNLSDYADGIDTVAFMLKL